MATSWWEILILCEPTLDDVVFWRTSDFGCHGTASEAKGPNLLVRTYLHQDQAQLLDLAALALRLRQDAICMQLPVPIVHWNQVDDEDWSSSWKQYWHPQAVGDRLLINPAWLPVPEQSDRLVLRLDPGVAFGTGAHPTTQLCLEALEMRLGTDEKTLPKAKLLADIGCGSGILSIGAVLLGAEKVYAVDVDPLAVRAAESNRELNQLDPKRMVVRQGSLDTLALLAEQPVDGFICNILAEVIIDLVPQMNDLVKPDTWGILSGILLDQAKPVAATLEQHGWIVAALWRRKEWCCFNIRRG